MDLTTAIGAEGATITNVRYVVPSTYTIGTEFGSDYWAAVDYARDEWAKTWAAVDYPAPQHVTIDVRATLVHPDGRKEDLPIAREKVGVFPESTEPTARRLSAERRAEQERRALDN